MENTYGSVIDNIKQLYDELFVAEKKVASYILENMQEVVMLNISELARKSGTSEATVVRMCKHLGYDGYYQTRLLMSRDAGKVKSTTAGNEILTSADQIFVNSSERIEYLSEGISTETLLQAARILLDAKVIHIISVGNSIPIAMDLGFRLERNGQNCTYSMIPEHFINHISLGSSKDVVVTITRSGSSTQVIRATELAHKKKMKTVIVTSELNKQLVDNADCIIRIIDKKMPCFEMMRPESHLLEMAINDALLYVVKNYSKITSNINSGDDDVTANDVDLLLSQFKL